MADPISSSELNGFLLPFPIPCDSLASMLTLPLVHACLGWIWPSSAMSFVQNRTLTEIIFSPNFASCAGFLLTSSFFMCVSSDWIVALPKLPPPISRC